MRALSEVMTQEAIRKQTLLMLLDTSYRSWGLCFCSNFRSSKGMFPEPQGLSEARVLLNCSCTHTHFVLGKSNSCKVKVEKEL